MIKFKTEWNNYNVIIIFDPVQYLISYKNLKLC